MDEGEKQDIMYERKLEQETAEERRLKNLFLDSTSVPAKAVMYRDDQPNAVFHGQYDSKERLFIFAGHSELLSFHVTELHNSRYKLILGSEKCLGEVFLKLDS
jgi:hypothetical protein